MSDILFHNKSNLDIHSLALDRIERIQLILRNIHFFPLDDSRKSPWPPIDRILGEGVEGLRLDPAEVISTVDALPTLPFAIMDILNTADNDDVPISDLAAKIEMDQGLVARLLRVANSPFYGSRRRICSTRDAIIVLGTGNVHNLILAASLSDYVMDDLGSTRLHLPPLLKHSTAVAICAKALAPRFGCNGNSAFTAGLLHDIGRLVLVMHYPFQLAAVERYLEYVDCYSWEAERLVLGIDHAGIGQLLAEQWNFPDELCTSILGHHDPELIKRTPLTCVVHMADAMAHVLEMSSNERKHLPRILAPCWQAAALSWSDCQEVFAEVELGLEAFNFNFGSLYS